MVYISFVVKARVTVSTSGKLFVRGALHGCASFLFCVDSLGVLLIELIIAHFALKLLYKIQFCFEMIIMRKTT